MPFLVQIFLPLYDNHNQRFPREPFDAVRSELTETFGGLTAYSRAPLEGLWAPEGGDVKHDDLVIYEVMAEHLDRPWWAHYRQKLEHRFRQEEVLVRSHAVERL